jgi:hypothetical protein
MADKQVTLDDFLTQDEIDKAVAIFKECRKADHPTPLRRFNARCVSEIIKPSMERINAKLGQENDAGYLAYMVEYVLREADQKGWLDKWEQQMTLKPVFVVDEESEGFTVLKRFGTIAEAEAYIAQLPDKDKVERGGYGIDAPEGMNSWSSK